MSLSKLSAADFSTANSRLQKAQANRTFSIDTTLFSPSLVKLVNAHADAIGVSPEFIFWPLLTATASMMGTIHTSRLTRVVWASHDLVCNCSPKWGEKNSCLTTNQQAKNGFSEEVAWSVKVEWRSRQTTTTFPTNCRSFQLWGAARDHVSKSWPNTGVVWQDEQFLRTARPTPVHDGS